MFLSRMFLSLIILYVTFSCVIFFYVLFSYFIFSYFMFTYLHVSYLISLIVCLSRFVLFLSFSYPVSFLSWSFLVFPFSFKHASRSFWVPRCYILKDKIVSWMTCHSESQTDDFHSTSGLCVPTSCGRALVNILSVNIHLILHPRSGPPAFIVGLCWESSDH